MNYVADFETTTDPENCHVWAWCVCTVDENLDLEFGRNIKTFIEWCIKHTGSNVYFHNLKFDGHFILDYLAKHDWKLLKADDEVTDKSVSILMSRMNQMYNIDMNVTKLTKRVKRVRFYDSAKKIPLPVAEIPKAFDLPIQKLSIDYDLYRDENHELTQEEKDYISNDCIIVAMALRHQFEEGLKKMTMGADALYFYKEMLNKEKKSNWSNFFPVLDKNTDAFIRHSYRGGIAQVKEEVKGIDVGRGMVADVNSMYPWAMYYMQLPYDKPLYYTGEYREDKYYPLYIQHLVISFRIKENHLPIIQIKGNPLYRATMFQKEVLEPVELWVTSVDLELIKQQYDIIDVIYIDGLKFKSSNMLFRDYIDYWINIKQKSTGAKRFIAKRMLNSLYGKFATNPDVTGMYPYLDEDEYTVKFKLDEDKERDPVYTALACFVTAWGRYKLVNAIQDNYDRFLYCDTDSIHVLGNESLINVEVHDTKLGAWAIEGKFKRGRYLRAKTYIEEMENGYLDVKCATMTKSIKEDVTFDNFHVGFTSNKKLRPVKVDGGIVLMPTPFTIKE